MAPDNEKGGKRGRRPRPRKLGRLSNDSPSIPKLRTLLAGQPRRSRRAGAFYLHRAAVSITERRGDVGVVSFLAALRGGPIVPAITSSPTLAFSPYGPK